jgi:hypothetical protein
MIQDFKRRNPIGFRHMIDPVTHDAASGGRSVSSTSTRCWSSSCRTLGFGSLSALKPELSPIRCLPQDSSGQSRGSERFIVVMHVVQSLGAKLASCDFSGNCAETEDTGSHGKLPAAESPIPSCSSASCRSDHTKSKPTLLHPPNWFIVSRWRMNARCGTQRMPRRLWQPIRGPKKQAFGTKSAAHVDLFGLGLSPSDRMPDRRGCSAPSTPPPGVAFFGIFPRFLTDEQQDSCQDRQF